MTPHIGKAIISPRASWSARSSRSRPARCRSAQSTLRLACGTRCAASPRRGTGYGPFFRAGFPLAKLPVASKTGTAEVYGKQTTSWFASYAPADKPQYAVVMMVSQGGTGPASRGRRSPSLQDPVRHQGPEGRPRRGRAPRRAPDHRTARGATGRHRRDARSRARPAADRVPVAATDAGAAAAYRRDEEGRR